MSQADSLDAIAKGTIDIIADIRPQDAVRLAQAQDVTIYLQPGNNNSYLAVNMDRPPFDKLGVRRAIANALDVRSIVTSLFPKGAIVADNWMPPGMLGDNASVKTYPFDLAKAKAELASAGYPNGFETALLYPTIPRPYLPDPEQTSKAIARQLGAIGIKVDLQPVEWGKFLEKVHNGEHAMCLAGWVGDNGDPDNFLYTLLDRDAAHRPNAQNYSFWRDPQFHDLMIAGQTTADPAKRKAIYEQATALISEMVPAIPIAHMAVPVAVRSSIGGYVPNPDTHISFEFLYPKSKT
jgi:peptide/nickel transport system substrate-binding protein